MRIPPPCCHPTQTQAKVDDDEDKYLSSKCEDHMKDRSARPDGSASHREMSTLSDGSAVVRASPCHACPYSPLPHPCSLEGAVKEEQGFLPSLFRKQIREKQC